MSAFGTNMIEFQCPLLGVKRTSSESASMSANDPKRTWQRTAWRNERAKFSIQKCDILRIPDVVLGAGRSHEATGGHRTRRLHRRRVATRGTRAAISVAGGRLSQTEPCRRIRASSRCSPPRLARVRVYE